MFTHTIEGNLIDKAVVADEADDSMALDSVRSPAEGFHVGIGQFVAKRGCRILRIGLSHTFVNTTFLGIASILVLIVLILLAHIIGRVSYNHTYGSSKLTPNTFGILRRKRAILACVQKCVYKTNPLKWLIFWHSVHVSVFDIHAGDVIWQQHDLVAVQLFLVLVLQAAGFDLFHHPRDEIPRSYKWVQDMNFLVAQAAAKLSLQH